VSTAASSTLRGVTLHYYILDSAMRRCFSAEGVRKSMVQLDMHGSSKQRLPRSRDMAGSSQHPVLSAFQPDLEWNIFWLYEA
jgi:hypothetical protein